jgi:diguanylate cyclase (GGDEF)-like protein/PAS domain S-box-containing protein
LTEQNAVPLVVVASARDPVETINSLLRRAGHAVHCTWIPALGDLADALVQLNPELLVCIESRDLKPAAAAAVRDEVARMVPMLVVADEVSEAAIGAALASGARDLVTLTNAQRFEAVVRREIRAYRLERALEGTLRSARDAKRQLDTVLQRSNDAIAQVQEGIVVDANTSWLELFGFSDREAILGQPVMDLFEEQTHAALKGALTAALQGRWTEHTLKASAITADGSDLALELALALGEYDGEPSVRLIVPARKRDERHLASELSDAVQRDPSTGFLYRRPLLEAVQKRLATPAPGGVRYLALVKPDRFASVESDVGVLASEICVVELAKLLSEQLATRDLAGRFGGVSFLALIERGNERDAEAWAEQVVRLVSRNTMKVQDQSVTVTCTVGLALVPTGDGSELDAAISDALEASRKGRQRGGNQVVMLDRADTDTRVQAYDKIWVKHIKAALMENRFRLVQQPVASLHGVDRGMFDVLVRMLDHQGKEVLPAEFMAAAERNDLLKNIDRWVVGASLSFAAQRKPGCLFVRLSRDTVKDSSFFTWLDNHMKASQADPQRLCFQMPESVAATQPAQAQALAKALHERGFRFALEGFGSGRDPQSLMSSLPLDFVKIDGALVQSIAADDDVREKVRALVASATRQRIETIAERVEDANTMAVLWQLGVHHLQGYFVNAPEQVELTG